MSAGGRRHLLTLQTRATAVDAEGYNDEVLTYTNLGTAWGSLEAVGSRERFESQQVKAEVSHRIKIRHSPTFAALAAADRITLGSRIFDIVKPMDRTGRSRELEILALERV